MPPKRELSQGQIDKIRALPGQLLAAEAKKRFGIGSTRLYKIWRDESGVAPQQPADPPLLAPPVRRSAQNLLPFGDVAKKQQQAPSPTVEDFYKRLEGLESLAEHSTRLLTEVLAQLTSNNGQDAFLKLEDIAEELATTASRRADTLEEARHEQTETRMDRQKDGQMVETAQNWTYISLAAILVWKVVGATGKRCMPVAVGRDVVQQQEKQGHTAAPPPPPVVAEHRAKPGDPFYMAG